MPSKFVVRNLQGNSYYHVYNRGAENRDIFLDFQDYETFLFYLFIYTAAPDQVRKKYPNLPPRLMAKNLFGEIYLIAYCLMPNHFHLLLKQKSAASMPKLLKQVINGYITYWGKKYKKSGRIFHGRYQSMKIQSEYLLIQMMRFVHLNPSVARLVAKPQEYPWSSYITYIKTKEFINRFASVAEWEKFHLDKREYELNLPKIAHLTID